AVGSRATTTAGDGTFSLPLVPSVQGNIVVQVLAVVNGQTLRGNSAPTAPAPGGITNVGDIVARSQPITIDLVPASPTQVGNCIPFGTNTGFNFSGFIYRNVPAFSMGPGGTLRFDLGSTNGQDIRRNIYLAVASANPAAGGQVQNIRALSWTK